MAIYLDSAMPEEARAAMRLGLVSGITTNPALLARAKRDAMDLLRELCEICPGTVFFQLTADTLEGRFAEAEGILRLNAELATLDDAAFDEWQESASDEEAAGCPQLGRLGLKIPASTENMELVAEFSDRGIEVAVTALFSLAQAYMAAEAGADYVLPYVNRMTRLRGDGPGFVRDLARVCEAVGLGTEVLAASIKSPDEAVQTLLAGAQHVSMPWAVLQAMGNDPLSEEAVAEFARALSSG